MYTRKEFSLMKRKVGKKIIYYYWVYDEDGRRIYRSTGKKTKSEANAYVLELRAKGKLGKLDKKSITLKEFTKDMFIPGKCPIEREAIARGKSIGKQTMINRRTVLTRYILPAFGKNTITSITPSKINNWLVSLPEKAGISRSTANNYKGTLDAILKYAVKQEIISKNPCREVEPLGSSSTRTEAFSLAEVKAIIGKEEDWKNPLVRLMCITSAMTGMRLGEVLALKMENIHKNYIEVKYSYNKADGLKSPKSGYTRMVPIPKELYKMLCDASLQDHLFIFSYDGKIVFSPNMVREELQLRCKELGIENKTFHSFRAFFNSQMVTANINESIIRNMIGHTSEKMTEHYLHLESTDSSMINEIQTQIL